MPEFTLSGRRNGQPVRLTWRDGQISGADHATVAWLHELARALDGTIQGLPGLPATTHDHLRSPYTAYALMRSLFPGATTLDQPLPPLDLSDVPDGAIL